MTTIKLRSPVPREFALPYSEVKYSISEAIFLPKSKVVKRPLNEVLARRRSNRRFGEALNPVEMGMLLSLAVKCRPVLPPIGRPDWQTRPYPAAGGCHPIDVMILNLKGHADAAFIYDPKKHALGMLDSIPESTILKAIKQINDILPCADASVICFISDSGKLASRYKNFESLLWRDSGALTHSLSLAAAALNYVGCPVGIHGPLALKTLLRAYSGLSGVGGFVVGNSPNRG